jgi:hypothetical protein
VFLCSVSQSIENGRILNGKKAEAGTYHIQSDKQKGSADNHKNQRKRSQHMPVYPALTDSEAKRNRSRDKGAGSAYLKSCPDNLQNRTAGTQKHPVKFTAFYNPGKYLKAVADQFRQGKGHMYHRKTKQHIPVGIAFDFRQSIEQKPYGKKLGKGNHTPTEYHKHKG